MRGVPLEPLIIFAKLGKELLACVLTAVMGLERGVIFQVSFVGITRVWFTVSGILQARILEWAAFPFSRGSSQPRGQTWVSHIAGGFSYQLSHKGGP